MATEFIHVNIEVLRRNITYIGQKMQSRTCGNLTGTVQWDSKNTQNSELLCRNGFVKYAFGAIPTVLQISAFHRNSDGFPTIIKCRMVPNQSPYSTKNRQRQRRTFRRNFSCFVTPSCDPCRTNPPVAVHWAVLIASLAGAQCAHNAHNTA